MRPLAYLLFGVWAWIAAGAAAAESIPPGGSAEEAPILRALRPTVDLRARIEFGDQERRDEAVAWTLRGRLGMEASLEESLKAFAEVEHTSAWHRDRYQAGSVHGRHEGKTVIADPESTELNQAWLAYSGSVLDLKAGIQRITLGNQRFVGNVGWRQNEQTYHGATLAYRGIERAKLFYGYVYNVDNIFGSERAHNPNDRDFDSRSHLVQASYEVLPALTLTAYSYLLDLENAGGAGASNDTYGASVTGTKAVGTASLGYRLEYARQADASDSQLRYRATYLHTYASLQRGRLSGGVGYERLGAGDGVGFQTPLATLHAFNGYADKFLVTPSKGLQDLYAEIGVKLPYDIALATSFHDYVAADDTSDFGYELDVVVSKPLRWSVKALLKGAFYNAEQGALTDTTRLIFQLEYLRP